MNPTRVAAWLARAQSARAAYDAADNGVGTALSNAFMAATAARLDGSWTSPDATAYLTRLRALRNADGGYGLNATADAFQDGTTNPANTSYTVTMAHHVGRTLLEAYRADPSVVAFAEVQQQVALVAAAYHFTTSAGVCLAYSRSTNDYGTTAPRSGYQVHNVNATAAAFLQDASADGFGVSGMHVLIVDQTRHLVAAYNPAWKGWPYMAGASTVVQDRDHQSATVEGCYALAYQMGREAAYNLMTTSGTAALDPLAHMRLVALPAGPGSMSTVEPNQTQWLVMGDNWLTEFDAFVVAQAGSMDRLAQAAYYASRNWVAASV